MLSELFQRRARYEVVGPPSEDLSKSIFGVEESHAGVSVTPWSAMTLSAVYACVRAIADQMAALPLIVYRRDGRRRERAVDTPQYRLLHDRANPYMSAHTWRATTWTHVLTWGNAFSEIEFDGEMRAVALWPIRPDRIKRLHMLNGQLVAEIQPKEGPTINLEYWRLHHVRGLASDGYWGLSPVGMAMQSIGLALAAEEYGARLFANDARPGVVLKYPKKLTTQEARDRLLAGWRNEAGGLSNAHRTRLLEDGMDLVTVGMPPEHAQFLETRQFQVVEIARWFRVPPSIIGDMSRATWSNAEQASLDFVRFCLAPWAANHEAQLRMDVLPRAGNLDAEYLFEGLLRGDTATRWASYEAGQRTGALTINDIRGFEGLDPVPNGDERYLPSNMGRLDEEGNILTPLRPDLRLPITESAEDGDDDSDTEAQRRDEQRQAEERAAVEHRQAIERRAARARDRRLATVDAYRGTLAEIYGRTVRKEIRDIRQQLPLLERNLAEFVDWLRDYYRELGPYMIRSLLPVLRSLVVAIGDQCADELEREALGLTEALQAWVDGYADNYAREWGNDSAAELQAAAEEALGAEGDARQAVEERLSHWESTKADVQANAEAVNAASAMAIAVYEGYRVERIRWRINPDACEICRPLEGKVVGIREFFAQVGDVLGGATIKRRRRHPPLHDGCICHIEADQG